MNTTCPICDRIFSGSRCACGYTAVKAARERSYSRAPCDFCPAPWVTQWVDFEGEGIRFVCRVHGDPASWLSGVKPRYQAAPILLESAAKDAGVRVHRGVRCSVPAEPSERPRSPSTMAAQVAEKLAMKEL